MLSLLPDRRMFCLSLAALALPACVRDASKTKVNSLELLEAAGSKSLEDLTTFINQKTDFQVVTTGKNFLPGRSLCIFVLDMGHFDEVLQKKYGDGVVDLVNRTKASQVLIEQPPGGKETDREVSKNLKRILNISSSFSSEIAVHPLLKNKLPLGSMKGVDVGTEYQTDIMVSREVLGALLGLYQRLGTGQSVIFEQNGTISPQAQIIEKGIRHLHERYPELYPIIDLASRTERVSNVRILTSRGTVDLTSSVFQCMAAENTLKIWRRNEHVANEVARSESMNLTGASPCILLFGAGHASVFGEYVFQDQRRGAPIQDCLDDKGINALVVGLKGKQWELKYEDIKLRR